MVPFHQRLADVVGEASSLAGLTRPPGMRGYSSIHLGQLPPIEGRAVCELPRLSAVL